MKTMETTEAVSSDGMEKRVKRHKSQRSAPCAREKPVSDWKKTLQIYGAGRKSRKRPTLVVGKKPYGKSQMESKSYPKDASQVEKVQQTCRTLMKLSDWVYRRWKLGVWEACFLAAVLFTAGCETPGQQTLGTDGTVYQPNPQIVPRMTAVEGQKKIEELLPKRVEASMSTAYQSPYHWETVKIHDVTVTMGGFEYYVGSNLRSFQFENISNLSVASRTVRYVAVDGPYTYVQLFEVSVGGRHRFYWWNKDDAVQFVDAVNAVKYYGSASLLASDADAFADFQAKAKLWRELPVKPALPEDVQRFRAQAEDAFNNKNYDQAAEYYERGLAIEPMWPQGQFNAALLDGELQIYAQAVLHMKRYLELRPDAQDANAARDHIYVWEGKLK